MYEIAKREEFYKQEYCGCIFSLRDSNSWRVLNGREEIKIGEEFYKETEISKELTEAKK
jgi:predicted adenine nucleotide alpha hydrolase (AANH) superfamily ATPase